MKAHHFLSKLIRVRVLNEHNHFSSVRHLNHAYKKVRENLEQYCSRYSLYETVGGSEKKLHCFKGIFEHPYQKNFKKNSAESVTYLDTENPTQPKFLQSDLVKSLCPFTEKEWPQFLNDLGDEIYLTIGCRKAFYPHAPGVLHHAILCITDGSEHGIFGYNKPKNRALGIDNDLHNTVSRHYMFYDELVIKGNKAALIHLLNEIEKFGHTAHYDFVKTNCFTILIPALLKAKEFGFDVPRDYANRLLIVNAKEQNLGLGMITNPTLRPIIEQASACEVNPACTLKR